MSHEVSQFSNEQNSIALNRGDGPIRGSDIMGGESNWVTDQRSKACYEREIAELKQQCDDLLKACKRMLGAMRCDELNNGAVFNDDLRKEVKEEAEAALAKAQPKVEHGSR